MMTNTISTLASFSNDFLHNLDMCSRLDLHPPQKHTPQLLNMKTTIAALLALSTFSPVIAGDYQAGYSKTETCTRNEYREEYVPGTSDYPGYVKSWHETIEIPCSSSHSHRHIRPTHPVQPSTYDNNDCSEGSIIGGLLGAGLTMTGSRGKDRWWAVPAGGAAGAMIGCQIDGG
jgi:hypothetical protein